MKDICMYSTSTRCTISKPICLRHKYFVCASIIHNNYFQTKDDINELCRWRYHNAKWKKHSFYGRIYLVNDVTSTNARSSEKWLMLIISTIQYHKCYFYCLGVITKFYFSLGECLKNCLVPQETGYKVYISSLYHVNVILMKF